MKRILCIVIIATLAGCAGSRPVAPAASAVVAPSAWTEDATAGAPIDAQWWQQFDDPVLARVVAEALSNNVDIAIASKRVEEARAQFRFARAQHLPNLVAFGGGARERSLNPGFGIPEEQTAGEAELSISYDLDLFGRLADTSEAVRASLLSTQAAHDGVRLAVAASAGSGYITLRALDARIAVLRDTLTARADSLHLARRRADAGYGSQLDLQQAEAEFRATEQAIPAAELAIARQEHGLSLLVGGNPRAIERGAAFTALRVPEIPTGLPSEVLRRRPDVAQAEQQLVAADHSLDAARAAFMPDIKLTASDGYVASTLIENPVGVFSVGGNLLAPLLDGGRIHAQADSAAARRDQAAFAYRKAALAAFRDVEDALAAVRSATEQGRAIAAQREALYRVLTIATKRYKAGYSPYLEQLDAQRGLLAAELALVQVRADRLTAAVSLFQALGGGWDENVLRDAN
jgi:outer membrane protein, multidrug efflux system